jgi:arginyl-tRNA--protein-N-Asp/Glu arginylyltransferase
MKFAQVQCPEVLVPEELDAYLEKGWFRMGPTIFTTNFLNFKNHYYSAIWLRVELSRFPGDTTEQKLIKKNSRFRVEYGEASLSAIKEDLYSAYKTAITFETSASLRQLLFGKALRVAFNTQEISVYDGPKLIAVGIFDLGEKSAAGITCFYDPTYKKYSLGKYLIYLKMEYCRKLGMRYFYPGYFVPGYPFFDYKLTIGRSALEFLQLRTGHWIRINDFTSEDIPLQIMKDRLSELGVSLRQRGIQNTILKYEFFDANLVPELIGAELFDFPLFLFPGEMESELSNHLVVYDVCDQLYRLVKCRVVWKTNASPTTAETYSSQVLKLDQEILCTDRSEEVLTRILSELKYQSFKTGTR